MHMQIYLILALMQTETTNAASVPQHDISPVQQGIITALIYMCAHTQAQLLQTWRIS